MKIIKTGFSSEQKRDTTGANANRDDDAAISCGAQMCYCCYMDSLDL